MLPKSLMMRILKTLRSHAHFVALKDVAVFEDMDDAFEDAAGPEPLDPLQTP